MEANIKELLESGANINLTVSLKDLEAWHNSVIADTKKELEEIVLRDKAEQFLTQKQVIEYTGFSRSTLSRWHKSKYLVGIETGGGLRYKMSDLKALLNGGRV